MDGYGLREVALALGLVLTLEGLLYAVFPETMRRALRSMLAIAPDLLQRAALVAAAVGVALVWGSQSF